jgi:Limiting CO2-inducible proteins B/C beta carbonyic anhydrases
MSDAPRLTINKTYPNARTTDETVTRLLAVLSSELGLAPHQVMHADSICCDDLNAIEYPKAAYDMLGPFKLGGLNGFPFAGLTGMGAFAHHVPEDGAVFVFHAPHIGITKTGNVGESLRPGQTSASACCGAARAALAKLERGDIAPGAIDELDYQESTLEQILLQAKDRILDAPNRIMAVTDVIYEAIERRIDLLASRTKYPCAHLVIMGGVLINGDHDVGSFCDVRRFVHVNTTTGERTDWSSKLEPV